MGAYFPCLFVCFLLITIAGISSLNAEDQNTASDQGKIVITDEDIKKMNVHSVVDLMNQIPGVSATESSIKFRGASTKNILVLLDGREINNPLDSSRAVNWSMVSLNAIKKIEIYKGGSSVLYGDGAGGGVVNIITGEITKGSPGNIELSYGRFNSKGCDLNYQQNVGNLGLGVSAGWERGDGFRANSDKNKNRISTKFNYRLDEKRNMALSFNYFEYESGSPGRITSPTLHARSEQRNWGSTLLLPLGRLKSKTHYTNFKERYRNPDTGKDNLLQSWTLSEELPLTLTLGGLGKFNLGADLEFAHVEGNNISSRDEEKYAIYAVKNIRLQKIPLSLDLGVRTNIYSAFPTVVNPQVQLDYEYRDLDINFSVSRSNNIPTFRQRYYESSFIIPNPGLKMETAINYNLSFSSRLKESLEGNISLFLNDITDRISYIREDSTATYRNIGSAARKGIETSIKWRPADTWQVKPSYTFLIARDEETKRYLTYSPKHRFALNLCYSPMRKLALGLDTKYCSKQFCAADNSRSVGGTYLRFDLRANYLLREKIKIFMKIANLFNHGYETMCDFPAAPRTWTMGMGYEF